MAETIERDAGMALIDALSVNVTTAREVQYRLADIAGALATLGMDQLADELLAMGKDMHRTAREAQGEFCRYQNSQISVKQQEIGNTLTALLHVGPDHTAR